MAGDRSRRLGTVRVRTTAAATGVVGVALIVGALLLMGVLRRNLTDNVETAARLRADDVVALIEAGATPDELAVDDEEASLVQVINDRGLVVAASGNIAGEPPIADLRPGSARTVGQLPIEDEGAYRVVAEAATTPESRFLVLAAGNLEPVNDSVAAVAAVLAAGLPVLLLLVAFTTWVVTGRALRPVESIRTEVTAITNAELGRRVPEPAGNDEVARLARTMNEMLARLESSRDRQQRFVSDASHELRSPIATIRHELEVLIANPGDADIVEVATGLLGEDLRMQALVEDLLVLARSDEGTLALTRRPVDLDDVLLAEAARLRSRGTVRVNATGLSAGQVLGDPAQLTRAVRNLVDNAERHATSTVRLALTELDGRVVLTVADDGPGIALADRARIFERFTRLDDARARRTGGYGLGLAIVQQVVSAHHGSVRVEDAPGGGATFTVDLPAASGANLR
jgi:signal transduction histidine kinase